MTVAFISHPECALHEAGTRHPERPARLAAIQDQLLASGLEPFLRHYHAPLVTQEQLCRVHDPAYVDEIFGKQELQQTIWLDADTYMMPATLAAARRAAGAVVLGVDLVMAGESRAAFCNVRPPGHHAGIDKAMGFCLFNNLAVGVAHAMQQHHVKKVAIVDFDVHHGNGTEEIFQHNADVLLCSSYQHPYYPYTGSTNVAEHIVNVPLAAGSDGRQFRDAVKQHWLPRLEAFAPELILISAGFDAHREDRMAGLNLVEEDFAWVTHQVKQVADKSAQGRIVSTLEGGYALSALGRSAAAHIKALLD